VKSIDIEGIAPAAGKNKFGEVLPFNEPQIFTLTATISEHQPLSQPYWLVEPKQGDTYTISNQLDVGLAENPPLFNAHFHLRIESEDVEVVRPVAYRYIERAQGELTRPVVVEPPVALQWSQAAMLFPQGAARTAELQVKANIPKAAGEVKIQIPAGWQISTGDMIKIWTEVFDRANPSILSATTLQNTLFGKLGEEGYNSYYVLEHDVFRLARSRR